MLYLLDASVLITAHEQYYPIDRVPEYWGWLLFQSQDGRLAMPSIILDEITIGSGPLPDWCKDPDQGGNLRLSDEPEPALVQMVIDTGYGTDLNDAEIEQLGKDPFLIAAALVDPSARVVVTAEISKPSRTRARRKIPDVCADLGIECCNPFQLNQRLDFRTGWSR